MAIAPEHLEIDFRKHKLSCSHDTTQSIICDRGFKSPDSNMDFQRRKLDAGWADRCYARVKRGLQMF